MNTAVDAFPLQPGTALLVDRDEDTRSSYADHLKQSALPGISGFDLCATLKRDLATRAVPVVMVTSDGVPGDLQRATTAGADAVLIKPCLPDVLQAEIQRVLERSRAVRSRAVATRKTLREPIARSGNRLDRSRENVRAALSRVYDRHDTTTPPVAPPVLICPQCDQPLAYQRSHIGGVSAGTLSSGMTSNAAAAAHSSTASARAG